MTDRLRIRCVAIAMLVVSSSASLRAELPTPVLTSVYPAGVQAGGSAIVMLEGTALDELTELRSTAPGFACEKDVDSKKPGLRFRVSVPQSTPPGLYEVRTVGRHGVSSPRTFAVSRLDETLEAEVDAALETPNLVKLDGAANGKIEKAGDVDRFRFTAQAGERITIECWAARIDSQLRAVLELYDARGTRLAVNRGYHGIDPLLDFVAPATGDYDVRVFDLTYAGGATHFYRLDLDTGPRPEFALPCVVERGKPAVITLFGRSLAAPSAERAPASATSRSAGAMPLTHLDSVRRSLTAPMTPDHGLPLPRRPSEFAVAAFAYHDSAVHLPVSIGLTDVPVVENHAGHDTRAAALSLPIPCEVSALMDDVVGRHWYSLDANRGEVLWFETFAERLGSPLDLELTVFDPTGQRELARLSGEQEDLVDYRFATSHADPVGRWVAPADGSYYVFVRDVIVGSSPDPRRTYRLSVRREEPDFALAAVSRRTDQPAGLNIARGGREWLEITVLRRRGANGPIKLSVEGLPPGVECAAAWIGPDQDRAPLVFTAGPDAASFAATPVVPITITGRYDHAM